MSWNTYLIFAPIALLSICSPGPATLLAIANSLKYGVHRVNYSTFGNLIGQLIVATLSVLGASALLQTSEFLFNLFKISGAVYLIYLGIKQWRSPALIPHAQSNKICSTCTSTSNASILVKGLTLALSNPKDIFFFSALLPQFVNIKEPLFNQFFILIGSFLVFSYISLMTWAYLASRSRSWLNNQKYFLWLNKGIGLIFITLGLNLLHSKQVSTQVN
jgi:homoserine/homoserine lactone efflux protein